MMAGILTFTLLVTIIGRCFVFVLVILCVISFVLHAFNYSYVIILQYFIVEKLSHIDLEK